MTADFTEIISAYRNGDVAEAFERLQAAAHRGAVFEPPILLIAGQAAAKLEKFAEAKHYYTLALGVLPEQAALLTSLIEKMGNADLLRRRKTWQEDMANGRQTMRSGSFDAVNWRRYRHLLRRSLLIDEVAVVDQWVMDRQKRMDPDFLSVDAPFDQLCWCDDEGLLDDLARFAVPEAEAFPKAEPKQRLHIGYLIGSASLDRPTVQAIATLAAAHDRDRFEPVLILSRRPDARLPVSVPHIHLEGLDSDRARARIRQAGLDILIDGFGHACPDTEHLLCHRLATVHVALPSYPGPRIGLVVDYLITDPVTAPKMRDGGLAQAVVTLPRSMPPIMAANGKAGLTRATIGLPQGRPIAAAFHPAEAISPKTARLWFAILRAVKDSLLWLWCPDEIALVHLSTWLKRHGIAENRLLLTDTASHRDCLDSIGLADLGLDCYPMNDSEAAAMALAAGVPWPAFCGGSLAARKSASVLSACNLKDLIAADEKGYVELCCRILNEPEVRTGFRQALATGGVKVDEASMRADCALLERALSALYERAVQGMKASSFVLS